MQKSLVKRWHKVSAVPERPVAAPEWLPDSDHVLWADEWPSARGLSLQKKMNGNECFIVNPIILHPQKKREKVHHTRSTCADEQDIVGAVHGLHSVHQQFAELVVNTHSDQ